MNPPAAPSPPGSRALPAGTVLEEFELIDVVGHGGFGIVYRARDLRLEREVAIKEYMPTTYAHRDETRSVSVSAPQYVEPFEAGRRSFINEARLLAQLDHPALVRVLRFWEAHGTAYMAMPYYRAPTLRQFVEQHGLRDEAWLRAWLAPMLEVLELLHRQGICHRDIAPDNVLMLDDRRPLLLDFGAARKLIADITQNVTIILKPGYAPLEQYTGGDGPQQGPWTDLYALAAVVRYCVTGKSPPPAPARVMSDTMPALASVAPMSAAFGRAIDTAMTVRVDGRPRSVAEFRTLLAPTADVDELTRLAGAAPSGEAPRASPGPSGRASSGASSDASPAAPLGTPPGIARPALPASPDANDSRPPSAMGRAGAAGALVAALAAALVWWTGFRSDPRSSPERLASAPPSTPAPSATPPPTEPPAPPTSTLPPTASAPTASAPKASAPTAPAPTAPAPTASAPTAPAPSAPAPTASAPTASAPPSASSPRPAATPSPASPSPDDPASVVRGALRDVVAGATPGWAVTLDVEKTVLAIGRDRLRFRVKSARAGFVHVLLLEEGVPRLTRLFPNEIDGANRVAAGAVLTLPRAGWSLASRGPAGRSVLLVLVSPSPRDFTDAGLPASGGNWDAPRALAAWRADGARAFAGRPGGCPGDAASCAAYGSALAEIEERAP